MKSEWTVDTPFPELAMWLKCRLAPINNIVEAIIDKHAEGISEDDIAYMIDSINSTNLIRISYTDVMALRGLLLTKTAKIMER